MRPLTDEEFSALFEDYQSSAFRLETRQVYTVPQFDESLRKFLAGDPKPESFNAAWHARIGRYVAAGKTMQRAKFVRRPLTDYSRYLLSWGVPGNVVAGEDYRILDVTDRTVDLPEQDFWIFDDETVALLNFNEDGTVRGHELADSAHLDQYRKWRDLALSEAIPWSEYRLQHPSDGQ
ncbi:DUF6879 family protein [Amycolatopsis sp. NPDC051128]|uniref:DUF6879 family protein n=1 Tax=Amycolatopsis sp. NPDC051128 TaxID=3155412 RepID=UPI00341F9037